MSRTVGGSSWPTRSLCQFILPNHLKGTSHMPREQRLQRLTLSEEAQMTNNVHTRSAVICFLLKNSDYFTREHVGYTRCHGYLWLRTSLIPFLVFPNLWPGRGLWIRHRSDREHLHIHIYMNFHSSRQFNSETIKIENACYNRTCSFADLFNNSLCRWEEQLKCKFHMHVTWSSAMSWLSHSSEVTQWGKVILQYYYLIKC